MFYTFDILNQSWIVSTERLCKKPYIPFSTAQNKAWCSIHKKWESCGKTPSGKIYFECKNPIDGQFVIEDGWTMTDIQTDYDIETSTVTLRVNLTYTNISKTRKKISRDHYKIWYFNIYTGNCSSYTSSKVLKNYEPVLPQIVMDDMQLYFDRDVEDLLGKFYPNTSTNKGIKAMVDYVSCPVCPQISVFKKFFGIEFYKIVKRNSKDPFKKLCNYLNISPTKRLKDLFNKNAMFLPVFCMLKEWEFKENRIFKCFEEHDDIPAISNNIIFNKKTKKFEFNSDDLNLENTLKQWCSDSFNLQNKSESMNANSTEDSDNNEITFPYIKTHKELEGRFEDTNGNTYKFAFPKNSDEVIFIQKQLHIYGYSEINYYYESEDEYLGICLSENNINKALILIKKSPLTIYSVETGLYKPLSDDLQEVIKTWANKRNIICPEEKIKNINWGGWQDDE